MNIKPGQTIQYKHGEIKIMAISENWAMVRYKGAMPFCELVRVIENWINDHAASFQPVTEEKAK